jgi:hypothetical protein
MDRRKREALASLFFTRRTAPSPVLDLFLYLRAGVRFGLNRSGPINLILSAKKNAPGC